MLNANELFFNELINKNHETFQNWKTLKWINPYNAMDFIQEKEKIYESLQDIVNYDFNKTKPWLNQLSPGCRLCGAGEWSCLFITGKCNANCFYCPAPQEADDLPTAQQLQFAEAEAYADFINHFNFKGCSFSGGEPFLVFDRLVNFLSVIRKRTSPELYIWLYTNGMLATKEKFKALADKGLNEVRFDIGAINYSVQPIKNATGIIPNITVEIPAVPEKIELLKKILPDLIDAGVTNFNLHQLRLTAHNVKHLSKHDYTYIHGEHPSVVQSELGALQIAAYIAENKLPIGINYCSFQYKYRFQKAGYRKKILKTIFPSEEITDNGFAASIFISFEKEKNRENLKISSEEDISNHNFSKTTITNFLNLTEKPQAVLVILEGAFLTDKPDNNSKNISYKINSRTYFVNKAQSTQPILFWGEKIFSLINFLKNIPIQPPKENDLFTLWRFFAIEFGEREYI